MSLRILGRLSRSFSAPLILALGIFMGLPLAAGASEAESPWLFLGSQGKASCSRAKARVLSSGQHYRLQWIDPEERTARGDERLSRRLGEKDLMEGLERVLGVQPAEEDVSLTFRLEVTGPGDGMDAHGFILEFRDESPATLVIRSPSAQGVHYGIWFFLQNFLGIRVLSPGDLGYEFTPMKRLVLPERLHIDNPRPDFLLRTWSGARGWQHQNWLGDFGSFNRYQFHHNLWRIFDPKTTFEDHPEFFPVYEGKRVKPEAGSISGWQPTFSAPGLVEHTLAYAERHFAARPKDRSISLTINDGRGYSELDLVPLPGKTPLETLRHHYFTYVRRVAEAVKERWPDKQVAILPYLEMARPPQEPLPDNVLVFLFLEPWEQLDSWRDITGQYGLYLWMFGKGWVFPNHWPGDMQALLQEAKGLGIVAFKGEAYPSWSLDGPKLWVLNNLLWNTEADVNALMADYCRHAYGEKAAAPMLRFFARAEAVYQRRKEGKTLNLTRWLPGEFQFEQVTEDDMSLMRVYLDRARAAASAPRDVERLDRVHQAFLLTELFWSNYQELQTMAERPLRQPRDVRGLARGMVSVLTFESRLDRALQGPLQALAGFSLFGEPGKPINWGQAQPGFSWADQDAQLSTAAGRISEFFLSRWGQQGAVEQWRALLDDFPLLLPYADAEMVRLSGTTGPEEIFLANGGLQAAPAGALAGREERTGALLIPHWVIYRNRSSSSFIRHLAHGGPAGMPSIRATGIADRAGVYQVLKLQTGRRYRIHLWYRTAPGCKGFLQVKTSPILNAVLPESQTWRSFTTTFSVPGESREDTHLLFLLGLDRGRTMTDEVEISHVSLVAY